MDINRHWRNKQLGHCFTQQEMLCLNFAKRHRDVEWAWFGHRGNFYDLTANILNLNQTVANGLIMINYFSGSTPGDMITAINKLLTDNVSYAYLAINQYSFIPINDLQIDYKHDIKDAIDQIVTFLNKPFVRIEHDIPNDNLHFVGTHGLDIFVYESN
jgi:hypothetical protein